MTLSFKLLLGAMLSILCGAGAAADIILKPIQVSPHVYYFQGQAGMASQLNQGYMSNAAFVVTSDGVLVFDALATPVLGKAMLAAIAKVTPQPVTRVLISHYHADHFYGLQAFKDAGAEVWAHENGKLYLQSDLARERLAQRRKDLGPWVDLNTRLVPADRWLSFKDNKTMAFEMGGMRFRILDVSGAHSQEDLVLVVDDESVMLAGDLFVSGRIPFVADADSRAWLLEMDRMLALAPKVAVPGHGASSTLPLFDMRQARDYLTYLRLKMGEAVAELTPFEEAYAKTDWSRYAKVPAFEQANRINAYGTYILMEKESLRKQ
jgi:glyoxylase-like metal-dependent hydrolase (beta-lactamase superfamily II)